MTHRGISKNRVHNGWPPGTRIDGKWHKNVYQIIRLLGKGATGSVYLVRGKSGRYALKITNERMAATSEVNVLEKFSSARSEMPGPSFIDADDWVTPEGTFSFYVMEYVQGTPLVPYVRQKGEVWLGILIVQLLADLEKIHQAGWVFGDLKPENLIVSENPIRIRWFDAGGITPIGRSIREYTEFYDRGYWGLGSRKADPAYDLFAVAMVMLHCALQRRWRRDSSIDGMEELAKMIQRTPQLGKYEKVLFKALAGRYENAGEMKREVIAGLYKNCAGKKIQAGQRAVRRKRKAKKKSEAWKTIFVGLLLFSVYFYYLFLN